MNATRAYVAVKEREAKGGFKGKGDDGGPGFHEARAGDAEGDRKAHESGPDTRALGVQIFRNHGGGRGRNGLDEMRAARLLARVTANRERMAAIA